MLPVFGFNNGKYDINLMESYSLPILINARDIKPVVFQKKDNEYNSSKFSDIQLPDFLNFLGGATSPDSFLKAYKTSEPKRFFPYEKFDHPDKM